MSDSCFYGPAWPTFRVRVSVASGTESHSGDWKLRLLSIAEPKYTRQRLINELFLYSPQKIGKKGMIKTL